MRSRDAQTLSGCCAVPGPSDAGTWMRLAVATLIAAQSMTFGLAINLSPPEGGTRWVLHTLLALSAVGVFALTGLPLWQAAWRALRRGKLVFEQLFLAGIFGAFFASLQCTLTGTGHVYYEVVAILLAIFTLGRLIGEKYRRTAGEAMDRMQNVFDHCDRVLPDGSLRTIPVAEVRRGDPIRVAVGGAVPVDGMVMEGTGFVRETALSGEPFPTVKRPGDPVRAGSFSLDAALTVLSTASGRNRELDSLVATVREAGKNPSTLQREADRIVAWFLPTVMGTVVVTFLYWTSRVGWQEALFYGLAVLVVACPCSMGLATPLGIRAALTTLARRGLLAHTSDVVLRLARIDLVVFDKTGTLGEPELRLIDLATKAGTDRETVRRLTAAVEQASGHPIARAFVCESAGGTASNVHSIPGAGIRGRVEDTEVTVGNEHILPPSEQAAARNLERQLPLRDAASRPVYILFDGRCVAAAMLRETARESAARALNRLEELGIPSVILTGDRAEAAAVHGWRVPVEAGLSPAEKADRIAELQKEGKNVLFVGDGVNDTPAMARAFAAIAIGDGSAVARETAMAELAGGDLSAVADGIACCRQTVQTIRGNLVFALCYNVTGISLAASGMLHPVPAALLMMVSSLTVTWRALRETHPQSKPRPARSGRRSSLVQPLVISAALALQGPLLAVLGGFSAGASAILTGLFLLPALAALVILSRRPQEARWEMNLVMFSLGGVLMLVGMGLDAAMRPADWEGMCGTPSGPGFAWKWTWMETGMVAAALPCLIGRFSRLRIGLWMAEILGMFVGMKAAAWVAGGMPSAFPQAFLIAGYMGMMTGMVIGMLGARRLVFFLAGHKGGGGEGGSGRPKAVLPSPGEPSAPRRVLTPACAEPSRESVGSR